MTDLPRSRGFTLAELLIALLILGVIATFTIPKVLQAQQSSSWNSNAKEVISTLSGVFQERQLAGAITATTASKDLTPYINYVRVRTSGTVDNRPGNGTANCNTNNPCLHLHNGGVLKFNPCNFDGTSTTNVLPFLFDPDGIVTGDEDSLAIMIHYNGVVRTDGTAMPAFDHSCGGPFVGPVVDPAWFSWN